MRFRWTFRIAAVAAVLIMSVGLPQAQTNNGKNNQVQPAVVNSSVKGSGVGGHLAKWVGSGRQISNEIESSIIVETGGKVTITASVPFEPFPGLDAVLNVQNTGPDGFAMRVKGPNWGLIADGGDDPEGPGSGILSFGGDLTSSTPSCIGPVCIASVGLSAFGGLSLSPNISGGTGVMAVGGHGSGASNSESGIGIRAFGGDPVGNGTRGLAGKFFGDVEVTGTLSAGTKNFKIDHPLDPENKYLYHTSVESPDMKNIYDGNVVTDENGDAIVTLPQYFEALNRDFRYQLTVIGTFAQAIVSDEIKGNRFVIRTSAPNVKVSWQVTGIRRDAWANRNRIKVEEDKPERERGHYLHPDAFDKPQERGIEWAHDRAMMMRLKQTREMREIRNKDQR